MKYTGKTAACAAVMVLTCLLTSCGIGAVSEPESEVPPVQQISLRIVDGADTGQLVLAGETAEEVYQLSTDGLNILLDDRPSDASILRDGMKIQVDFDGSFLYIWPAQLGSPKTIHVSSQTENADNRDMCGLYLQVLQDLWDTDPALNEGVTQIGVNLTEAPGGLNAAEQNAVAWILGQQNDVDAFCTSFQQLKEEEKLTQLIQQEDVWHWEDGVLITVYPSEDDPAIALEAGKERPTIPLFHAEKWRSASGADMFSNCTAYWDAESGWDYQLGSYAMA